jgi:hypothetical protein
MYAMKLIEKCNTQAGAGIQITGAKRSWKSEVQMEGPTSAEA